MRESPDNKLWRFVRDYWHLIVIVFGIGVAFTRINLHQASADEKINSLDTRVGNVEKATSDIRDIKTDVAIIRCAVQKIPIEQCNIPKSQ